MRLIFCCFMAMIMTLGVNAQKHYTFESGQLGAEWQYVGEPDQSKYCFAEGKLRLIGSVFELFEEQPATFTGLAANDKDFVAETKLTYFDTESGDEAGLCLFASHNGYVQCCVNTYQGGRRLRVQLRLLSHQFQIAEKHVSSGAKAWLLVRSEGPKLKFYYSTDGKDFHWMEDVERRLLGADIVGGDGRLLVGMYSHMHNTKFQSGYSFADFEYFDYQEDLPK